ncbi:MAG TPA: APC family permease [Legionellaceae bacterium]|nr:APC family permease [Legionellaceae bacterium]
MKPKSFKRNHLGPFALIMMAIISVDSLRNLPIAAQYGFSLLFFYAIAGLFFFLPLTWVTNRLAIQYPKTGGSYVWIREAYGHRYGHFAICLQWLYNMIWYPTIFAFITATFATLISPDLAHNKWFIVSISLGLFWGMSFVHSRGIQFTSWINIVSALIGTLLPMVIIIALALYWLYSGKSSATSLHWKSFLPSMHDIQNIGFFSNILFSIFGIEVIAVYAGHVVQPEKVYPRALIVSASLILLTLIFSSMALCVIMPVTKITLVTGIMDVLNLYFAAYHIHHISWIIGICVIIGGLGIASSWMIGLAKSLHISLSSMNAPAFLQALNRYDAPAGVLYFQALVYSILCGLFLCLPSLNKTYWILSAATAQFALLYYVIVFLAAMKLITKKQHGSWQKMSAKILPLLGISICVMGLIVGFIPPDL